MGDLRIGVHTFSSRPSPRVPPSIMQTYRSTNVARVCCGPSSSTRSTTRPGRAEVASITNSRGRGDNHRVATLWIHAGKGNHFTRFQRRQAPFQARVRNGHPVQKLLSLRVIQAQPWIICTKRAGRGCFSLRPSPQIGHNG